MNDTIVIKPLTSVLKITKIFLIFSSCFSIALTLNLLGSGYSLLTLIELILFASIFIYNIFKLHKLKKSIYIIDSKDNILINKQMYKIQDLKYKIDKHLNLILYYNNKKIIKISRLSYNLELLKQKLQSCDK